jgi:hypothetical protein
MSTAKGIFKFRKLVHGNSVSNIITVAINNFTGKGKQVVDYIQLKAYNATRSCFFAYLATLSTAHFIQRRLIGLE